ncbi:hypothetical protein E4U57_004236 [Claviceps arundinis]|uniref:Uncharacterized protein n=1 Tax=Claviceps arundinis TaxID=1623583 RepID=A0A9P7MNF9_9HYPO|nr:hypothetical protein E4U57_004236 [Claviceps arundinis]KAG5961872.1 hypothetical protein E4U56_003657 [Claviceps arundinis]
MSTRRGEGQGEEQSEAEEKHEEDTGGKALVHGDAEPDPQCCLTVFTAFKRWQGSQWDCDNGNSESRHARAPSLRRANQPQAPAL